MYKSIEEFNNSTMNQLSGDFKSGKDITFLSKKYGLTKNEVLSILEYKRVEKVIDIKRIKRSLPLFDINSDSFIVISDTHIGSEYENMEFIKYVYEYAKKQKIKHILHAGDVIQSTMRPTNPKLRDETIQVNHFVDDYPNISGIKTHILFGNHDFHTLIKDDNYMKVIKTRKDFDILGFKRAYFTWNKHLFSLKHEIPSYKLSISNVDEELLFAGHRHEFDIQKEKIMLPCLCDEIKRYNSKISLPGFIEVINNNGIMKLVLHSFKPINYEENIFESEANIVKNVYSRKLK